MSGWIKLHTCLLDKAIWTTSTPAQRSILITILALANWKENQWHWKGQKFACKPGQFVTSSSSLALKSGTSRQSVRGALLKFQNYEFLTYESTKTGLLIAVVNWGKYQGGERVSNQPSNQEATKRQPRGNQEATTIEDYKTIRPKDYKNTYAESVTMTGTEYRKLVDKFGEGDALRRISKLSVYKESKGKKYKSDYHTILMWASREDEQKPIPTSPTKNIL